jgi:hypothetical protein
MVEEAMTHPREAGRPEAASSQRSDLGRQYRAIGIGAVAAALTFSGNQKNEAYAPVAPKAATDEREYFAA